MSETICSFLLSAIKLATADGYCKHEMPTLSTAITDHNSAQRGGHTGLGLVYNQVKL